MPAMSGKRNAGFRKMKEPAHVKRPRTPSRKTKAKAAPPRAFYDEELLAPLRDPAPGCRATTTPLYELVSWLAQRRGIGRARIRFAGTGLPFTS